jgi:hypothetical protein
MQKTHTTESNTLTRPTMISLTPDPPTGLTRQYGATVMSGWAKNPKLQPQWEEGIIIGHGNNPNSYKVHTQRTMDSKTYFL